MFAIDIDRFRTLGLTPALATHAKVAAAALEPDPTAASALPPGPTAAAALQLHRIARVDRDALLLRDPDAERPARVLPALVRRWGGADTPLAVGDWVLAAPDPHRDLWVHAQVPSANHIARCDADGRRHAVASNVDTAFLVMGLDDDFSPRRIERYLALVAATGGITPVVVLTKADRARHVTGRIAACIDALRGRVSAAIDLHAVDATDPHTVRQLQPHLDAGRTLVVLGSSGAGKSTLTNTLLGTPVQDTGPVRGHDSRGKHTTTSRSLHRLPGGAWLIDTPGLRTLRADGDEATLAATFADIRALAAQCRFRDCTHAAEPGCAVREGVAADRLANYRKMLREGRRDAHGALERHPQLGLWKARTSAGRERAKSKRGLV